MDERQLEPDARKRVKSQILTTIPGHLHGEARRQRVRVGAGRSVQMREGDGAEKFARLLTLVAST